MILDTDVVIDLLRRHPAAVAWLAGLPDVPTLSGMAALEVATFNQRHFASVPGLATIQPYVR